MKKIRQERKMNIGELSRKTEVSERHLLFIESGDKNPSLKNAIKIAKALETSVEKIFDEQMY